MSITVKQWSNTVVYCSDDLSMDDWNMLNQEFFTQPVEAQERTHSNALQDALQLLTRMENDMFN